jgi:hypothetical protein
VSHPDQDSRKVADPEPAKRQWAKPTLEVIPMKDAMGTGINFRHHDAGAGYS